MSRKIKNDRDRTKSMLNSHYNKLDRKNEDYFDLVLLDRNYNPKVINALNDYRKGENSIYMKDYTKKAA